MIVQITLVLVAIAIVWLGVLTFLFRKLHKNYTVLTDGVNKKTLDVVLSTFAKDLDVSKRDIAKLISRYDTMEKDAKLHIQKIGLLRFNPFKDTGGDQSFILTLIDAHDTGVVITALYSRSGTRWYAKRIIKGKGVEHELSDEEKKSIKLAQVVT